MHKGVFMNWSTILFLSVLSGSAAAETLRVYIGTAQSDGIYFAELNTVTGSLSAPKLAAEAGNAGFLAIHPSGKHLYTTGPAAFRINPDGTLEEINRPENAWKGSCHVSRDRTGRCLMSAYYGSGAAASFKIMEDGSLSGAVSFHREMDACRRPAIERHRGFQDRQQNRPDRIHGSNHSLQRRAHLLRIYEMRCSPRREAKGAENLFPKSALCVSARNLFP
jgi:hypothetical protein